MDDYGKVNNSNAIQNEATHGSLRDIGFHLLSSLFSFHGWLTANKDLDKTKEF
jgi:hypothetical protein